MSDLRRRLPVIAAMYGLSGALGLLYEVAFNKYLAYVFGATAYASSAVLVAFMAGLALGAHLASRLDPKIERPLFAYGIAELLIGIFCAFTPFIFEKLTGVYVSAAAKAPDSLATLTLLRASMAVLVVLVPAAGMGATLPLLARFVQADEPSEGKRLLARLYALNTAGGAIGSLVSAYVILPAAGLPWTLRGSAAISATIGIVAVGLGRKTRIPRIVDESHEETPAIDASGDIAAASLPIRDAVILSAASGLLVFGCEVIMVHLLALVIGTSVYAFGLMLFIFLVCLSFGTPIATRLARRFGAGAASIGFAMAGIALLLSLLLWDRLPAIFIALGPIVRSWGGREMTRGLAAFVALAVPVMLMGTTFPLVLRAARTSTVGADVGRLTVANTMGSVAGSILAGFVVLSRLGSQRSLVLIALAYLAFAAFSARHVVRRLRLRALGLVAAGVLIAVLLPKWNLARLTNGANVYFDEGVVPNGVVEMIKEDVHGGVTTIVRDASGNKTVLTNGKFQGNDSLELHDNHGFAHLPVLFAPKRDRAMVIGLGTGVSAGTVAAYDFKRIDIVELSPAIIETALGPFKVVNRDVMRDPRVRLLVEDGRNVLLTGHETYDVISIEVSSIWFAGAANLYNQEFYELVSKHLEAGGILQQWIQLHHTNRQNVATIIGTLRKVFPHVVVAVSGHQGQMLASMKPLVVSRDRLAELENVGHVRETLGGAHLVDYVKGIVIDETGIDAFLADTRKRLGLTDDGALVSTDMNLVLEYSTPKGNIPTADDIPDTLAYLSSYKRRDTLPAHIKP
jgi:spermidine synthase